MEDIEVRELKKWKVLKTFLKNSDKEDNTYLCSFKVVPHLYEKHFHDSETIYTLNKFFAFCGFIYALHIIYLYGM